MLASCRWQLPKGQSPIFLTPFSDSEAIAAGCFGLLYIDLVLPLREKALIARIRRQSQIWPGTAFGIGDDCAVLQTPKKNEILLTTDFSLEGVHFRRKWHAPESVGHRCLARGLSDIAAMGGKPLAAFLSLALPKNLPQKWANQFFRGFLGLADRYKVTLAGGDVAQSPSGILADIVVAGVVSPGQAVLRSRASVGDMIYVTGDLGGSAETLHRLMRGQKLDSKNYPRHFFPEPRLKIGKFLREKKLATAMIDLSDGLSTDMGHICEESGVGARFYASAIPRAYVGNPAATVALDLALHGGEDYELLFTARPNTRIPRRIAGVSITQIGQITRNRGMALVNEKNNLLTLKPQGWEHFSR
jgi:thiamine-monophosphate kinase